MRTLSRRAMIGVGAVTAGGTVALAAGQTKRGRRLLHQVGIVEGPNAAVPDVAVEVERLTLTSSAMGRDVRWRVAWPDGSPSAVLVCLHGRHADERFAFDDIGVHRFVADAGHPWAVASVDGGGSSYWHRRSDGSDPQRMVLTEFVPEIRRRVGDVPLLLLGWSMGGYGALLAAATNPDAITAVAASSPAIWRSFDQAATGAFDDTDDFARNDLFRHVHELQQLTVRIDCGRDDPFVGNIEALARELPDAPLRIDAGFHDAPTWRSFISAQLDHFAAAL